jgi:hypothetical protein
LGGNPVRKAGLGSCAPGWMDGFGGCEGDGLLLGRLGLEINSWMGRMGHGEMNSWILYLV